MNHGAIAKNGKRLPFPYYPRLAQVDAIIAIRHVGLRIPCPVLRGAVIVPVERAVIDALGLEEDDRIIVFNGRDQQTFGDIRGGWNDSLDTRHMGEDTCGARAMGLSAEYDQIGRASCRARV